MFIPGHTVMLIGCALMIFGFGRGRQHKFKLPDGGYEVAVGIFLVAISIFMGDK